MKTQPGDQTKKVQSGYGVPDVIWVHPESGASVFVGDLSSARSLEVLERLQIYNIVNAQGLDSECYHEGNPKFTYLRFPIGNHFHFPHIKKASGMLKLIGIARLFNILF